MADQKKRAEKSLGWQEKGQEPKEYTFEVPIVYRPSQVGSPKDVPAGEKANIVGQGSRGMSHSADREAKIPLKNRSG